MSGIFNTGISKITRNPAVVIALLAAAVQALEAQDVLTWNTFVTVVAGVVIRQFVVPADEVVVQEKA